MAGNVQWGGGTNALAFGVYIEKHKVEPGADP